MCLSSLSLRMEALAVLRFSVSSVCPQELMTVLLGHGLRWQESRRLIIFEA